MESKIYCGNCVQQRPLAFAGKDIEWISLLEQGVPALCPECGPIYYGARVISRSTLLPDGVKNLAAMVCGVLLFSAGVKIIDKIFQ